MSFVDIAIAKYENFSVEEDECKKRIRVINKERFKIRDSLYREIVKYISEYIKGGVFKLESWVSGTHGARVYRMADDDVINAYFAFHRSSSMVHFLVEQCQYSFYMKDGNYYVGYVNDMEDIEAFRTLGIEVSIDVLLKLKEKFVQKLSVTQDKIDMWVSEKMDKDLL